MRARFDALGRNEDLAILGPALGFLGGSRNGVEDRLLDLGSAQRVAKLFAIEVVFFDHGIDECFHLRLIDIDGQRAGGGKEAEGNAREQS